MAAPISTERLVKELEKLRTEMESGELQHSVYDQKLARVVRELRERGLEGDRAEITAALDDCQKRGVIPPAVRDHLNKRLGLV